MRLRRHPFQHGRVALCLLPALLLCAGRSLAAPNTFTFTADTVIGTGTLYDNMDIIVSGCKVTIDGAHTFHSLLVQPNSSGIAGIVTHDAGFIDPNTQIGGMNLTVTTNVTIQSGCAVTADSLGYGPGLGPSAGTTGSGVGGGGGYGGDGANGENGAQGGLGLYGDLENPTNRGSGGGNGDNGNNTGGAGGGVIVLNIGGSLQVYGRLSANGQGGDNGRGGGGAGGSINLKVGSLVGGYGSITAIGGSSYGGGGGGRIAVYYTNGAAKDIKNMLLASAWHGGGSGGAGTLFLKAANQRWGDLYIDNAGSQAGWTHLQQPYTFDNLTATHGGRLTSVDYHQTQSDRGLPLTLTIITNCTIDGSSAMDVYGEGYGPGLGPSAGTSGSGVGGGGGYGGDGANGENGAQGGLGLYGDLENPTNLGSGGGSGDNGNPGSVGGAGGGVILLNVGGTLQVDGVLGANGQGGDNGRGGGGAGGSINLNVGSLIGGGSINALGGPSYGEGGGGRIALYYTTNKFFGTLSASAWPSGNPGGAGTLFLKSPNQPWGDLIIDNAGSVNGWTHLPQPYTFDNLTISHGGILGANSQTQLSVTVLGKCTVGSNSSITASAQGYGTDSGPGAGALGPWNDGGSGGSYGGQGQSGARSNFQLAGTTYGSAAQPTDFGSGGGTGYNGNPGDPGGYGGGAIYLVVNNTLQVDGNIQADGQNGQNGGGGGSGGSIWIVTNALSGNGFISANGGWVGNSGHGGGGGGGGRVAVYSGKTVFPASHIAALGGSGSAGLFAGSGSAPPPILTPGVTIKSFTLASSAIPEGQSTTGTIVLSGPASADVTIPLSTTNPSVATVQESTVTILAGKTSAVFTVVAAAGNKTVSANVTAFLGGLNSSAVLLVTPWIASLSIDPFTVPGGVSTTGTISLNAPAPSGGLTVTLTGNNPLVSIPAAVTIPEGQTSQSFSIGTGSTSSFQSAVISVGYGAESQSATLYLDASVNALAAISVFPWSVYGSVGTTGVVSLAGGKAHSGGVVVELTSSDPSAVLPATVTIPDGRTSASFPIQTSAVKTSKAVVISARLGTVTKKAYLIVRSTPYILSFSILPPLVQGGIDGATGIVVLEAPATHAVTVLIKSNKPEAIPDATVTIPAGQTTAAFNIDTLPVSGTTNEIAVITTTLGNIRTATLTLTP